MIEVFYILIRVLPKLIELYTQGVCMLLWVNLISTLKIILRNLMLSPQLTFWITDSCSSHCSAATWEASGNLAGQTSAWSHSQNRVPFSSSLSESLVTQMVKNLPAMQETQVQSLGQEDPLEKKMATHSSILAQRIPWTEEPGRLQTMGSQESDMTERLSTAHISDI